MEYSDLEHELGCAFKICLNCRKLGPDKPAMYIIPKGSNLPPEVHDRLFPIAKDHEIPRIYEEYFNELSKFDRMKAEKNTVK